MRTKNYTVWVGEHYNRFMRSYDLVLTCAEASDDNLFPIQVFADDRDEARGILDQMLGAGRWVMKDER